MCHNPGTWHNSSQVKLTSEESCQRTNCKAKYKLESQNPLENNGVSVTWEQSYHCHLWKVVPMSLENNGANVTWEKSWQVHWGIIVFLSLGYSRASVTWVQLCQCQLITMVAASLGNYCASVTWEHLCQCHQCHSGKIVPVSLGNKPASVICY